MDKKVEIPVNVQLAAMLERRDPVEIADMIGSLEVTLEHIMAAERMKALNEAQSLIKVHGFTFAQVRGQVVNRGLGVFSKGRNTAKCQMCGIDSHG